MAKLEKLTTEQEALMAKVRDEWIDLALHAGPQIDEEEATAGAKWLYYAANLKEPEVVFIKGPADFAKKLLPKGILAKLKASVGASVWDSVRASVWDSVRASVWDSVRASVWASVGDSVGASVGASVWDSVRASVWASVWASVGDSVGASVWDSVRASVGWTSLAYDADWAAWYDYFNRIGVVDQEKANKYLGYLKTGAFFGMFFEKKVFIMCRPVKVEQDERKRLHSTTGPALVFADKTELYRINGVNFEKDLWKKVVGDKFSPQEVFKIENTEQRRIAYELMDKKKMLGLKDYKVLDETTDEKGNPMKIISFKVEGFDNPFIYYNCFCPTTMREYFLQTDKTNCKEAKASSFGAINVEWVNEW